MAPALGDGSKQAAARRSRRIALVAGIVYYVSGHGYGHAVRSALVVAEIQRRAPGLPIWVRTDAPSWLFPAGAVVEPATLDVGVLQRGSLNVRPRATLARYAELIAREPEVIARETRLARERGTTCVVADIPSAAFAIADRLGVPGIGVANFCWHWMYEPYTHHAPQYSAVVEHIRRQEQQSSLLLRLPFSWEFDCFPHQQNVPLIGRAATMSPEEVRAQLGLDRDRPVALWSFSDHGVGELRLDALHRWKEWAFIMTEPDRPDGWSSNVLNASTNSLGYVNLLAAVDAVITKPGFGIVSDALVNHVPVLYSDRGQFREYAVLTRALRRFGRAVHIPRRSLAAGDLGPFLDRLSRITRPWTPLAANGAEVIAARILEDAGA